MPDMKAECGISKDGQTAINKMVCEISSILQGCDPSIYLYGSSVLNDFRLGWSDIDILFLKLPCKWFG